MKKRGLYVLVEAVIVGPVGTSVDESWAATIFAAVGEGIKTTLLGYQETPAVSTTGFGEFRAKLDDKTNTIHYTFSYSNLEGQNVAGGKILFAHVHFGQTGVAGGVSFFMCDNSAVPVAQACPERRRVRNGLGRHHSGQRDRPERPGHRAGLVRRDRAGHAGGIAYANIHTTRWPNGEIRGQINDNGHDD